MAGRVAVIAAMAVAAVATAATATAISPAAATARRPSAAPAARSLSDPVAPRSVRPSRTVPDIAGEPIPFGTARYFGAIPQRDNVQQEVGMAVSPGGRGYWIATSRGGVFSFGRAKFHGAVKALSAQAAIVAIVATRDGGWLLAGEQRRWRLRIR